MRYDTVTVVFITFATISAVLDRHKRQHDTIGNFYGNCSVARHQQLQEWIPEGCPSIKDTHIFAVPPDEYCNAQCGQYLYESLNECYGEVSAFEFEQECSVNATGTQCYLLTQSNQMVVTFGEICLVFT